MALFDIMQEYAAMQEPEEWHAPTFKETAMAEIDTTFFNTDEFADIHNVDGNNVPVVIEDDDLRQHSAHWEAGAKQNFDTGLYDSHSILYIKVADYGPKPKIGKQLVMDAGTSVQRTYFIANVEEERGVYRMTLKRARQ